MTNGMAMMDEMPITDRTGGKVIWISLNKDNLLNMNDNILTFGWDPKIYKKIGLDGPSRISIEHLTLPKYYPYILVKNKNNDRGIGGIYNASGKGFEMKLVPVQRLQENTSYRQLGMNFTFDRKVNSLSLQLSVGTKEGLGLELNLIPVAKVTKNKNRIKIRTKYPHNLNQQDFLVIEFPELASCYKVTNLEIFDDYQLELDSPFAGYFSSNFKLIRNNWDLDLTLKIQF